MSVITLALAKEHLQIAHARQDNVIQAYLDGAEGWIEERLGVKLATGARVEDLDGGDDHLYLTFRPATAITSVVDLWNSNAAYTSRLEEARRLSYVDSVGRRVDRWPEGARRFRATYTAGYVALPAAIKGAVLLMVYRMYQARGGEGANAAAGASLSWAALAGSDIMEMIKPFNHRRVAKVG